MAAFFSVKEGAPIILTKAATAENGPKKKSVAVSGALAFFLGPIGLLYAAPVGVALPAALAWALAIAIIPGFLLMYIAIVVCPLSAIAGVLYGFGYNRAGKRVPLLGRDPPAASKLLRR